MEPCPSPKLCQADKSLISQLRSGDNSGSMITLLLHVLRLLPFLFGGHRQLAVENLALRQQLAVYKRTTARPKLRPTDRLFFSEAVCQEHCSLVVSAPSLCSAFVRTTDARVPCSLCEVCHPSLRAVSGEWHLARA